MLAADRSKDPEYGALTDAFGNEFLPLEEPMPNVKLAGGFDVTLRTMFRGQPCQNRYGKIENASYPISKDMRTELASALSWLGSEEHKNVTWTNTDKKEILFVYPFTLPEKPINCVRMFKRLNPGSGKKTFESEAQEFIKDLYGLREAGADSNADRIQIYLLENRQRADQSPVHPHNAGWLLKLYRENVVQIKQIFEPHESSRFTDEEKAQLFLGFIADFPKKAENETETDNGGN